MFENRWHLVCHVSELGAVGDYVCLPLGPRREIAVMNFEGYLHAFDNLCPHRGARIFTELAGNRPPVCGYHGRCARPTTFKSYAWRMVGDWLFVCEADLPMPVDISLSLIERAPVTLKLHSRLQFVMDCHWTVAVENALDLEHVAHVHADGLARLELRSTEIEIGAHGSSVDRMESSSALRFDRLEPFFEALDSDFSPGIAPAHDYVHAFFYPYSALSTTRGFTYSLQNYFPTEDGRTFFMHRLYTARAPARLSPYFEGVRAMNERTFVEDAEICAQVAPNHDSRLGDADARIAAFRARLAVDAPRPASAPMNWGW